MPLRISLFKLILCGPGDVRKELSIAKEVIDDWNLRHGDAEGFWIQYKNWTTDTHPSLGNRPQEEINRQIIDDADAIVAVFSSRFGTPTGFAGSGTEEEIRLGIQKGKKVMVYFADLEPMPITAEAKQLKQLERFRTELHKLGLCGSFNSREEFQRKFATHLALMINEFKSPPKKPTREKPSARVKQSAKGNNIVQVGGDVENLTINQRPPSVKKVLERRPESVSSEEALQIREWIEALAEGEIRMFRKEAFGMWWSRFQKRFKVEKYEALPSARMPEVKDWYRQQAAIQKGGLKSKAPELWRRERIKAIKAAMTEMGVDNETYYPELAHRLKLKPFTSLKDLTKRALESVYNLALRDRRKP